MPPRPSRGLSRGAVASVSLAGADKCATAATLTSNIPQASKLNLVRNFKLCTINVRTMNEIGAPALLDKELSKMGVGLAGLQEVRWPGVGEMKEGDTTFVWSGSAAGEKSNGVALAMSPVCSSALLSWKPISDRMLLARFKHIHGVMAVIVAYAPTESAEVSVKEAFYGQLEDTLRELSSRDLRVCLGDFNAVSGTDRLPSDRVLGPHGCGTPNENSGLLLALCRNHDLRIAGSWFRRKDIHRWSWYSNDGHTKKEIDHILVGCRWRALVNCRTHRGFEFSTDHRPVVATIRVHPCKRKAPTNQMLKFDSERLKDPTVSARFMHAVEGGLSGASTGSVEGTWCGFKSALCAAAKSTIGTKRFVRQEWISSETLDIIDERRAARLAGNRARYRELNGVRRRALHHDHQVWADNLAAEVEDNLQQNHSRNAFANIRRLRARGPRVSAPIRSAGGEILSDEQSKLSRWNEYFSGLLNNPVLPVPDSLREAAANASQDPDIRVDPPSLHETQLAVAKLKNGKASGCCCISAEMLKHGGDPVIQSLNKLFGEIWESESVPSEWRRGIILPLYKGKGSRSECGSHRGITLLSVPGKAFAHLLLSRMRPKLLESRRQEQSGFTPGRSTTDRILALNVIAQTRREYQQPLYATYVDLKAAFDSINRPALWSLLISIGIPPKIVHLFRALYSDTESCVRINGRLSDPFPVVSGVRQGCVLAPDAFNTGMDWVLGRTTHQAMCGVSIGTDTFTDLDYADDVALLTEIVALLESTLEIFAQEAAPLGLAVNWGKTKIQSLSDFEPSIPDIVVKGQTVESVDEFVYLGSMVSRSCRSSPEISRRIGMTRHVMKDLDASIWHSRLTFATKLRLYNTFVLPVLLYGSETWTLTQADSAKLDAVDQFCLRRICGVHWSDHISNAAIRKRTGQPPVTSTIAKRRLSLFGHVARADKSWDVVRAVSAKPPKDWRRPRGRPRSTWLSTVNGDLSPLNLGLHSAWRRAQDRQGWKALVHRATLP